MFHSAGLFTIYLHGPRHVDAHVAPGKRLGLDFGSNRQQMRGQQRNAPITGTSATSLLA